MTYHGTISNQPHKRIRRDQAQANDYRVAESLQVIFVEAGVDDEEEDVDEDEA